MYVLLVELENEDDIGEVMDEIYKQKGVANVYRYYKPQENDETEIIVVNYGDWLNKQ